MIDAVLSLHMNPATCGVAKFNHALAQRLGVPCLPLGCDRRHPLLSIKPTEIPPSWNLRPRRNAPYDVFLHGLFHQPADPDLVCGASAVYVANVEIARALRLLRPDLIEAFCPSTLVGNPTRADLNVLMFGMAHKLQLPYYEKLKALLDATGQDYTVCVSTAVHEGSPWESVSEAGEKLRAIFGEHTRVLGYLADDALAKELRECTAVAMFFDPALRANNTTFWAALGAGAVVITNLDGDSPTLLAEDRIGVVPAVQMWADIKRLNRWPTELLEGVRSRRCQPTIPRGYTWDDLLHTMGVSVTA